MSRMIERYFSPAPIHESRLRLGDLVKTKRSAGWWWSSDKADWKSALGEQWNIIQSSGLCSVTPQTPTSSQSLAALFFVYSWKRMQKDITSRGCKPKPPIF